MARRRITIDNATRTRGPEVPGFEGTEPLPLELLHFTEDTPEERATKLDGRARWFTQRGIPLSDWSTRRRHVLAGEAAAGIPPEIDPRIAWAQAIAAEASTAKQGATTNWPASRRREDH